MVECMNGFNGCLDSLVKVLEYPVSNNLIHIQELPNGYFFI